MIYCSTQRSPKVTSICKYFEAQWIQYCAECLSDHTDDMQNCIIKSKRGLRHNSGSGIRKNIEQDPAFASISAEKSPQRDSDRNGYLIHLDAGPIPQSPLLPFDTSYRTLVKVTVDDDIFVMFILPPVEYDALLKRLEEKLRYCRGWSQMKEITYTTADGDVLSLGPESPLESIFGKDQVVSLCIQ